MTDEQTGWVKVAAADDIPPGTVVGMEIGSHDVAVYHLEDGEFRATSNVCTHEYARLCDGWFEDGTIECPLHGGVFDVRTGRGLCPPVERNLDTYEIRVADGDVFVRLPSGTGG
jgi:nitrite reductase/ring-hydroxylating ferredoxin subunit